MAVAPLVFLDASAIVPFEVERDQWHRPLRLILAGFRAQGGVRFLTTNWTLYEAISVARRTSAALSVSLFVRLTRQATIVEVTRDIETEALRRVLDWTEKGASVVDHANLLTAVRHRCDAVLSFDRDFIPLAAAAGLRILR